MLKKYFDIILKFFKTNKLYFASFVCLIILVSFLEIFYYTTSDTITINDYEDYFNHKKSSIPIPKNLNFAEEKVPITDSTVRVAIEKELVFSTYWKAQSLLLHKRASCWFPIIEPILKKNNIPDDFKYVALIESQLTNVVSPQGATGFWQLIASTAKAYGLEVTDEVDERYNVAKSTEAACSYFKEAYKQYKNWTLVAASYNLGITGIQSQLDKQKTNSYFDLKLTQETSRYVYKLLAMKEIISRPKVYGYKLTKKDLCYPTITKKINVDSTIHNLENFALSQKINFQVLKIFNPWLLTNKLTNPNKKKYVIEIPKNALNLMEIYNDLKSNKNKGNSDSVSINLPKDSADFLKLK